MANAVSAMATHRRSDQATGASCAGRGSQYRARHRRNSERGAALLFALAVVLIVALLVFGVTVSATQDYSLVNTQMDSASALNTAEAGLTWELNKLSRLQYDSSLSPDVGAAKYIGELPSDLNGFAGPRVAGAPTVPGTVSVYVTDSSNSPTWTAPNYGVIVSTGT